mmetsp:Transcript_36622/g.104206  ORF Transcript_36622/g.104206 Transcript_36622/m.104206 type:complete len:303 (+) Transcript_36622:2094-3002(+)
MSHRPAEAIHGAAGETVSTEGALVPGAAEAGASAGSGEASLAEELAEAEELLAGLALDLQLVALDLVEFPRALATHLSDLPAPFRLGLDVLRRLLTDVVVQLLYSLAVAEGIDAGRRIGRHVIGRKCCCWYCCHLLCPCSPVEGRGLQIHRGREAKTQHCRHGGTAGQPRGAPRRRRHRPVPLVRPAEAAPTSTRAWLPRQCRPTWAPRGQRRRRWALPGRTRALALRAARPRPRHRRRRPLGGRPPPGTTARPSASSSRPSSASGGTPWATPCSWSGREPGTGAASWTSSWCARAGAGVSD